MDYCVYCIQYTVMYTVHREILTLRFVFHFWYISLEEFSVWDSDSLAPPGLYVRYYYYIPVHFILRAFVVITTAQYFFASSAGERYSQPWTASWANHPRSRISPPLCYMPKSYRRAPGSRYMLVDLSSTFAISPTREWVPNIADYTKPSFLRFDVQLASAQL